MIISEPKRAVDWEPMRSFLLSLRYKLSPNIKSKLKQLMNFYNNNNNNKVFVPNKQLLNLYSSKCHMSIDKAKLELGYIPKYNIENTKIIMEQYIEWLKLIDK